MAYGNGWNDIEELCNKALPIPQRRAFRLFWSCGGLTIWTRHGFFLFPALLSTPPYDTTERSSMLSSEI